MFRASISEKEKENKGVLLAGKDCWSQCGRKAGLCDACGENGICCRKGWRGDPEECLLEGIDFSYGKQNGHTCRGVPEGADIAAIKAKTCRPTGEALGG